MDAIPYVDGTRASFVTSASYAHFIARGLAIPVERQSPAAHDIGGTATPRAAPSANDGTGMHGGTSSPRAAPAADEPVSDDDDVLMKETSAEDEGEPVRGLCPGQVNSAKKAWKFTAPVALKAITLARNLKPAALEHLADVIIDAIDLSFGSDAADQFRRDVESGQVAVPSHSTLMRAKKRLDIILIHWRRVDINDHEFFYLSLR